MSPNITLDAYEQAKVQEAIPTSSNVNKIYHASRAMIYCADAGTKKWSYAGIQGALVFVLNTSSNTLHFQMVDLDGAGGVIWQYELHHGLVLDQEKAVTFFLSFEGVVEGDKRRIGFVFIDDSEATTFHDHVKNNKDTKSGEQGYKAGSAKPKRSSWTKSISTNGGNNIDKPVISPFKKGHFVRPTLLTDDTPPLPEGSLPPQPGGSSLSRGMETTNPTSARIYHSRPHYSESFSSPVVPSHYISRNRSIFPSVVPSRSASSTINAGTPIRRQESHRSQRVDLPSSSPTYIAHDEERDETVRLPFRSSQPRTVPWILASRTPHAPKGPGDSELMAHMADIRRQISDSDTSSTGSTKSAESIVFDQGNLSDSD